MSQIIAFGNPVYDEIITPFISTEGRVLSGCSTNACLALTRLGRATALVGAVGADYAERFRQDLASYGVVAYPQVGGQTGGFRLVYDRRGDRTLDVLGVADPIREIPPAVAGAAAVIIGPILQETPPELVRRVAAQTRAPIVLDPQGLLRRQLPDGRVEHFAPERFGEIAQLCHVIKANEVEAQVLTGVDPRGRPQEAVERLRALGCQIAIVTLAEAGSWIDDGRRQIQIPAYATDAVDPTGAGDTYMAGFVHAFLADPQDLFRAGCFGSATASIWIEHSGPDAPVTLSEVSRRVEPLLELRGKL